MRYMFLVYTLDGERSPEEMAEVRNGHRAVMEEAMRQGIFEGASPLQPIATATTVRHDGGKVLVTDGPFAETKEQLGGYYILDCKDLDEAIEWAKKIPTKCQGRQGCIEVRPLHDISEMQQMIKDGLAAHHA